MKVLADLLAVVKLAAAVPSEQADAVSGAKAALEKAAAAAEAAIAAAAGLQEGGTETPRQEDAAMHAAGQSQTEKRLSDAEADVLLQQLEGLDATAKRQRLQEACRVPDIPATQRA